ncbi:MAG TPA: MBL fold metallo-hydrolase [Anaerolineales bacterium]|nr:MBL fold metallo-hydrolase [Anaerolineales bacterium]
MNFSFHRIPVGICNCYLLRGERTVLIDAGAQGFGKGFMRGLQKLNVDPKEISLILITHGHWDHIGSLYPIQQITGAQVAVHHYDQAWVENGNPTWPLGRTPYGKAMIWSANRLIHPKLPHVNVDFAIDESGMSLANYGIPGKVFYTPGHTLGHVSIILDSGEAFVGDMAMNDWYLRRSPGLPIFADVANMLVDSWKTIFAAGTKRVYPAHGPDFPVEIMQQEISNFAGSK